MGIKIVLSFFSLQMQSTLRDGAIKYSSISKHKESQKRTMQNFNLGRRLENCSRAMFLRLLLNIGNLLKKVMFSSGTTQQNVTH